jgi:hypothetical protein
MGISVVVHDGDDTRVYKAGGGPGSVKKILKDIIETERINVKRKNGKIEIEVFMLENYDMSVSLSSIEHEKPIKKVVVDFKDR